MQRTNANTPGQGGSVNPFRYRLKNKTVTRTIRIQPDSDGRHFLLEVIDTCLTSPELSWIRFDSGKEAEEAATQHYQESLAEGFIPTSQAS